MMDRDEYERRAHTVDDYSGTNTGAVVIVLRLISDILFEALELLFKETKK